LSKFITLKPVQSKAATLLRVSNRLHKAHRIVKQ